jgi:exosome complex component MTR3
LSDTEREYSAIIKDSISAAVRLENYPKSQIDIYCYVLESDGSFSTLASAITCASIALMDAGIELYDLVIASTIGFQANKSLSIDPSLSQESILDGTMLLSYMPSHNQVTHIIQNGNIDSKNLVQAMELATDTCIKLHETLTATLCK